MPPQMPQPAPPSSSSLKRMKGPQAPAALPTLDSTVRNSSLAPVPPDAINYEKVLRLLIEPHLPDGHERHIFALKRLARVYSEGAIPPEHEPLLAQVVELAVEMAEALGPASNEELSSTLLDLLKIIHAQMRRLACCPELIASLCDIVFSQDLPSQFTYYALESLSIHCNRNKTSESRELILKSACCALEREEPEVPLLFLTKFAEQYGDDSLSHAPAESLLNQLRGLVLAPKSLHSTKVLAIHLAWHAISRECQPDLAEKWAQVFSAEDESEDDFLDVHLRNEIWLLIDTMLARGAKVSGGLTQCLMMALRRQLLSIDETVAAAMRAGDRILVHGGTRFALEKNYPELLLDVLDACSQSRSNTAASLATSINVHALRNGAIRHLCIIFSVAESEGLDVTKELSVIACEPVLMSVYRTARALELGTSDSRPNAVLEQSGMLSSFMALLMRLSTASCAAQASVANRLGAMGFAHICILLLGRNDYPASFRVRRRAASLLAALCANCKDNQLVVSQCRGVRVLSKMLLVDFPHPEQTRQMQLSVLAAVWMSVCGCRINEEQFFDAGGIFKLLDLICVATPDVVAIALSVLVDLLENYKTRRQIIAWSSPTFLSATELMLKLWRSQNLVLKLDTSVTAIDEMRRNNCGAIYGILSVVGFDYSLEKLNEEDRVLLVQIERYVDFKVGIVWQEIAHELRCEGVEPVGPDKRLFNIALETTAQKRALVEMAQRQIRETHEAEILDQEREYFKRHVAECIRHENRMNGVLDKAPPSEIDRPKRRSVSFADSLNAEYDDEYP